MGLSRFLRSENEPPKASAFDAIPDEVRQAIANDLCVIIECVKCWRPAIQSPEHAKAMIGEVMTMARSMAGKFITVAITGKTDGLDEMLGTPEAIAKLGIPEAIKDIFSRVKVQMAPVLSVVIADQQVTSTDTTLATITGNKDGT